MVHSQHVRKTKKSDNLVTDVNTAFSAFHGNNKFHMVTGRLSGKPFGAVQYLDFIRRGQAIVRWQVMGDVPTVDKVYISKALWAIFDPKHNNRRRHEHICKRQK